MIFNKFDRDGDGVIDKEEFMSALESLYLFPRLEHQAEPVGTRDFLLVHRFGRVGTVELQ
jgi:hypothetical protein